MIGVGSKEEARQAVWDALLREGAARFPLPPHGRIPNFAGAQEAAERLLAHPLFRQAKKILVGPDSPQRFVRELMLRRGITVFMPTPRLRGGFRRFDPAAIPENRLRDAASLSRGRRWGKEVSLAELPRMDLVVTGSVAVTRKGLRCGKGRGYGDLEYAILRELGHPPMPVATTVHPLQIVEGFPRDPYDLSVSLIATAEQTIEVRDPPPPPEGIVWDLLSPETLQEMPVLKELWNMKKRPDIK